MSDAFWLGFWIFMSVTSGGIISIFIFREVMKEISNDN